MEASTMVNFRIPSVRYRSWQREARRRSQSLSAFLRSCIDEVCERAAAEAQVKATWRESLPPAICGLVGIAPMAESASVETERDDYYGHLEEKYA